MRIIYTLFLLITSATAFSQLVDLDVSFGNNGKVHTAFGTNESKASAVGVQPDGKIIVAGSANSANTNNSWQPDTENSVLVRYNSDGSLDSTFGYNGKVMNDIYQFYNANQWQTAVYSIKILPNGKILTYGKAQLYYGAQTVLVRYNSNGSIDNSFGNNGLVTCNSSPIEGATSLIIQPDDKIVALGVEYLQPTSGVYISKFVLERFNDDGSIDSTFATLGRVVTEFIFGYNTPASIGLQSDGKIVAVGSTPNNRFAIARYTANGLLDNTFDTDGKVITSFGAGINAYAKFVSVYPTGKIMVVGMMHNTSVNIYSASFARYNPNGSLDTSFDGDGLATNSISASDSSINIISALEQSDGKFIVITSADPQGSYSFAIDFVTRRYNADGTTDLSFGVNGKVITTVQPGFNTAKNIAIQADGKILVAGHSHPLLSLENDFNVLRYNSNGTLDASFDNDGKVSSKFDSTNDDCTILLTQTDDKHIAIGTKNNFTSNGFIYKDIAICRYNTDGSLDNTFGIGGKALSFAENKNYINNAVLQANGKIVISNIALVPPNFNTSNYELIRYNSNGSLDSTFGINGKAITEFETKYLLSQIDGKVIAISLSWDTLSNIFLTLNRYTNTGILDNTFDNDGIVSIMGGFNAPITAIIQPDGKIIVSTFFSDSLGQLGTYLNRFNSDGSLDSTFLNSFLNTYAINNSTFYPKSIFIEADNKFIVAGYSQGFDGLDFYMFTTIKYNLDGSIDTSYGTNGILDAYLGNHYTPYRIIQSIVLQPDGKFLVALGRTELNPVSPTPNLYDFVIVRFDTAGAYDNTFGSGGVFTAAFYNKYDEAFSMNLQSDYKIVVAGSTDTGINRDFGLIRLNNNIDVCLFNATSNTVSLSACNNLNLNGQNYSSSGTYSQTLTNSVGCDSLLTLNLTINNVDVSTTLGSASIMANSTSGSYQWIDCSNGNSAIVGATNQIFTPNGNGNFAVIITHNSCVDTSSCISILTVGLTSLENNFSVNIYPNPTNGIVHIEFQIKLLRL